MRIGIDAMGGDRAPTEEVRGALEARSLLTGDDRIVLVGNEQAVRPCLELARDWRDRIELVHAEQVIHTNEAPVEALRAKPNSSIAVMTQMHRNGQLDATISAGHTGAFVAAAQMNLRRLRGVHRPGITIVTPAPRGPVALCDVGANVQPRPQHLHQYGIMASVYMRSICGIANPRVALLSIGEEDAKGNPLVKAARDLMKADANINFVGNVEGRDLFRGSCDVVVCDGFVGNVVLKLIEGMAHAVMEAVFRDVAKAMPQHAASLKLAGEQILSKYDFNEYGGAPLLGVGGICIICHGASNYRGIYNAVRVAKDFATRRVNEQITELLSDAEVSEDA
jgi:glycerol-3-phosphate acyltransferase PlsX